MPTQKHPMPAHVLAAFFGSVFGQPVLRISRPGGANRPVFRVRLPERTVIAVYREDSELAEKERVILSRLAPVCGHVPVYLGSRRGFTFQSDAGTDRLSRAVNAARGQARRDLARDAYTALFDLQHAAQRTDLAARLDPIDMSRDVIGQFATGPARLARKLGLPEPAADWDGIATAITPATLRFTKSDCRAGNAALDAQGALRWFDFELSGLRHGAEDMGWLTADEIWPVDVETCCELVSELATAYEGRDAAAFMDVFRIWTVLQMSRRLRLIVNEARRQGWVAQSRSLKYDFVGTDPRLAARLADKAAILAADIPLARSLAATFSETAGLFRRVIGE